MRHWDTDNMDELIELQRHFATIRKDDEPNLDAEDAWTQSYFGWMQWPQLLSRPRVVLLAEALSGKTSEFQQRQRALEAEGKFAFFVTIEQLADAIFDDALEPKQLESFKAWSASQDHACFFLDSIDEARLNRKSFDTALKRLAREVKDALGRISVYVSCRISDWNGSKDREAFDRLLPVPEPAFAAEAPEGDPLLSPLFGRKRKPKANLRPTTESEAPRELLVVRLVPLTDKQRVALAVHAKVPNIEAFIRAIGMQGLSQLAERPGDLLDLAEYWKTHHKFGSYAAMVEFSVNRKLAELDKFRPDNADISPADARIGAERLAAALSLAKTWTIRSAGADADPTLSAGALDPGAVLPEWSDARLNALLRRGLFAPATYGRIRFHRRATQEYLFSCWLHRLLCAACPMHEVSDLLFVEAYGVRTIPPSLQAAAAWLALKQPEVRDEIAAREPLILLRHGDPGSLPIATRQMLLRSYAQQHALGEVSSTYVEPRDLWMFSNPALGTAIREVWNLNRSIDFRTLLLRAIREGAIVDCADLARTTVLDPSLPDAQRSIALQGLSICSDDEGLRSAARQLMANPEDATAELASEFAQVLYPSHLTTEELMRLIERSQPSREGRVEGFAQNIATIFAACPDATARDRFIGQVASLCLQSPFVADHRRISARFADLAKALVPIAKTAITTWGKEEPSDGLIQLLMAIERHDEYDSNDNLQSLRSVVQANPALNCALFWADAEEVRRNDKHTSNPTRHYQVFIYGAQLWEIGATDIDWLTEQLTARTELADRRLVLSALVSTLQKGGQTSNEISRLHKLIAGEAALLSDLDEYLSPRPESPDEHEFREQQQQRRERNAQKRKADQDSWVKFKNWLLENPSRIVDPPDVGALRNLTDWLRRRSEASEPDQAALHSTLLAEGFGPDIPQAYREALKALWRRVKPARPTRASDSLITTKWENLLALAGIGVEAAQNPAWIEGLNDAEVVRAAKHTCMAEQGHPSWLPALLEKRPTLVAPVILAALKHEWRVPYDGAGELLSHYAQLVADIPSSLQGDLLRLLMRSEPDNLNKLERGLRILGSLKLDEDQRRRLLRWTATRIRTHSQNSQDERAVRYLVLYFFHDVKHAVSVLSRWIHGVADASRRRRAELAFGTFFGDRGPSIVSLMDSASIADLERLAHLVYRLIDPKDDEEHVGVYSPSYRDHAEDARNSILKTLLNRRGEAAYAAALRLSETTVSDLSERRARQLAHQIAERDSDLPPWTTAQVLQLEQRHTLPVRFGSDLLRVVIAALKNIQYVFDHGDASSKELLTTARDEGAVQNWLAEQLKLRSKERFHAFREVVVADENRPDVTVSSASSIDELAIEAKHANKGWTLRDLEEAVRTQIAKKYLRASNRRHGILVVTLHGSRTWRRGRGQPALSFDEVIAHLQSIASVIKKNDTGPVELRVIGLSAAE